MKTKELTATAVFAAVTAVLAPISIPLPFTPVPLTMALIAVFLTGAVLPPKNAFFAQLIYLLLGAAGLPVFSGLKGGVGVLAGPTGGYLVVYPVMALFTALAARRIGKKSVPALALGMLCALAVCYLGGSLWFCAEGKVAWQRSLELTVLPFAPFDLLKIAVCAPFGAAVCRALEKAGLPAAREKAEMKK